MQLVEQVSAVPGREHPPRLHAKCNHDRLGTRSVGQWDALDLQAIDCLFGGEGVAVQTQLHGGRGSEQGAPRPWTRMRPPGVCGECPRERLHGCVGVPSSKGP